MTDTFQPPRYMDFMTGPPLPPRPPSPAPEPGFVQNIFVTPEPRGSKWRALWAVTGTEHEEFVGTKTNCVQWAKERSSYVKVYIRRTQTVERS